MFIARMGKDAPDINRSVDAFAAETSRRKLPVEVVNYPDGVHAFDTEADTDESRAVIAKAIAFVKHHLVPSPEGGPGDRVACHTHRAGARAARRHRLRPLGAAHGHLS
jgi:hypothetical protein